MINNDNRTLIASDRSYLTIRTHNQQSRFHANWLRDNALDSQTRSEGNGQKLISLLSLPENSLIDSAVIEDSNCLLVHFVDNSTGYRFPFNWLDQHSYDSDHSRIPGWIANHLFLWDRSLGNDLPMARYSSLGEDGQSLYRWLNKVAKLGFALLDDIPEGPDGLLKVTALFGYARETNYGKCFDVRSEIDPINLAYTGLGLQAHTDNPYRDPVPTMQILACMENNAEGGKSVVVDGFNAANLLREESQRDFDLLSQYPARFSYSGANDICLQSKRPMIELGADGELIAVRFNNRSAAPFTDIPFEDMTEYYQAYRHFAEIIERDESKISFKLKPRQLFIVDNTRVLHSRTAFSGAGSRWLRGCYPDKDGLVSTLTILRKKYDTG